MGLARARELLEGLRSSGTSPTPAGMHDARESIRNFNLGSLPIGYSPTQHTGLDFAELSIVTPRGRFRR